MKLLFFLCGLVFFESCKSYYDLQITHATVFDTKNATVLKDQNILIRADTIVALVSGNKPVNARKTIDAAGKLVTPGIIDAHIHPMHFFGEYEAAPSQLAKDSLTFFRKKFSDNYLPYGVTVVMIMGEPESWLKPILDWSAHPAPNSTDIYTVGGALISAEDRKPYIGHITVASPAAARQKVLEYYNMGTRHLKLYWRLRRPEFEAAYKTADSLGMRVYGHIDNGIMNMDTTLAIGLRSYEHVFTIMHSITFSEDEDKNFYATMVAFYGKGKVDSMSFVEAALNEARFIVENKSAALDSLIDRLAESGATFSTTIHLFAEKLGLTYFSNPGNKPDSGLSDVLIKHNAENFKALMTIVKKVYNNGIKIRIGTDVANGGKAALSEQLLLAQYGLPIPAIIQISTINGATALGMEAKYGSIEKGKKADLIIYDKSPLDDYKNFRSSRTIIKDGQVCETAVSY
jgi:imidazolonepropionase-like amidohydrolase